MVFSYMDILLWPPMNEGYFDKDGQSSWMAPDLN